MENKSAGVWRYSPELPKVKGAYWCELDDKLGSKNGAYFNGKEWETYVGQFILRWLDESVTSQQITDDEIEKMAEKAGYPQYDKKVFESTHWMEHNIYVEGAKAIRDLINKQ